MPFGDGTGPAGMGPMTGRAMGYCAGYPHPGYITPGFGYWGRGFRGGGRGWSNRYYATGLTGWMRSVYPVYAPLLHTQRILRQVGAKTRKWRCLKIRPKACVIPSTKLRNGLQKSKHLPKKSRV
ncbi:DUF5320 domain-containing protein [candidate division KSB1 bacterium]|nr:DUF5320 domain-containing protein [candidate division KSB1 bacterium]